VIVCDRTRLGSVAVDVRDPADRPKSTREFAGSFVVQLIRAVLLPGDAATEEISGAAVSGAVVENVAGARFTAGAVVLLLAASADVTL
jgi:hypothetical protein